MKVYNFAVVIPTYNAAKVQGFSELLNAINNQTVQPLRKLVIDSSSSDNTIELAEKMGFEVTVIPKESFSHGGTRQQAMEIISTSNNIDYVIYMTQDVELETEKSLEKLLETFYEINIGAAYGRQLPKKDADFEAKLLREFNYPCQGYVRELSDKEKYGIKTAFLSDSFAAYKVQALQSIGGFPKNINMSEDMYVGAKMLLAGYRIAYNSSAKVYHSHNFSMSEHFKRYKAIGEFQKKEQWISDTFGKSEGEGVRLLLYMLKEAWKKEGVATVVKIIISTGMKYIGYSVGRYL